MDGLFSETCEETTPLLVTHVVTSKPNRRDNMDLNGIHMALEQKGLLPDKHLVDAGYVDAQLLVESQEQYQVQLIGPALSNNTWQAKEADAYRIQDFAIDWHQQQATCPHGRVSRYWKPALDHAGNDIIRIGFSAKDCNSCPMRTRCTKAKKGARYLGIRPQAQLKHCPSSEKPWIRIGKRSIRNGPGWKERCLKELEHLDYRAHVILAKPKPIYNI